MCVRLTHISVTCVIRGEEKNTKELAPTTHNAKHYARPAEQGGIGLASKPVTAYDAKTLVLMKV